MSENVTCLIWRTPASEPWQHTHNGDSVDSPRAGGRYYMTNRAQEMLEAQRSNHSSLNIPRTLEDVHEDEKRRKFNRLAARLTSWLIEQRRSGNEHPVIEEKTIKEMEQRHDLRFHERADRLLQYIRSRTIIIGDPVYVRSEKILLEALAQSESTSGDEVAFLLNYFEEKGWIRKSSQEAWGCVLMATGYAYLAELEKVVIDSSQAFVAMWFHESMENAYRHGIEPGIEAAGYKAIRIDRKVHSRKIDDEIIAEIRRSRFLVADFTQGEDGSRGGVYYEAGFAHGLNIPVIFTCRKDISDKVHLDIRQYNRIQWENPTELRERLPDFIAAEVGDRPLLGQAR